MQKKNMRGKNKKIRSKEFDKRWKLCKKQRKRIKTQNCGLKGKCM